MAALTSQEVWRPVPGLADRFEASTLGRIRRAKHTGRGGRGAGTIVRLALAKQGYLKFCTTIEGVRVTCWAHQLVALAFHGPRPDGQQVAHRNGFKPDIRPDNLIYATPRENTGHKIGHGTLLRGEFVGTAKLTPEDVLAIRASAEGSGALAARYGVNPRHVWRIRKGYRWQHLGVAA